MSKAIFSKKALITYTMAMSVGLLYSLVVPTLSVFLGDELGVRPFLIGTFFVSVALMGIMYSQSIALWSDYISDRRILIFLSMLSGAVACFSFGLFRTYSFVLISALIFFGFSFSASAQVLALAREYADQFLDSESIRLFNALLRSCVALAWVLGPPLGFSLLKKFGFCSYYLGIAGLYLFVAFLALLGLPKTQKIEVEISSEYTEKSFTILVAIAAFCLLYAVNHSYIIALPLFLSSHFGVHFSYAGWLMGTAAAIEIPVMIFAGWLSTRVGLLPLVRFGAVCAILLFAGFSLAQSLWQLFALQVLNALFIGFVSGLGISLFQDMLPRKPGVSSTLFLNAISAGNIMGSLIIAIFADIYGFRQIFILNSLMAAGALLLLFIWKSPPKTLSILN